MTKQRKLYVSILNITMQPHSTNLYVELFNDIFASKTTQKYFGEKYGIISKLQDITDKMGRQSLYGEISIFTNIDKDSPWFNFKSLEEAEAKDINEIRIPDNLRPNLTKCSFVFDATKHLMYFVTKNGSISSFSKLYIENFMRNLLNIEHNIEKYGNIAVNLIPDENAIESLFSYPQISRLSIVLTPPNPDDLADEEARLMNKLNAMQAKKMEQTYFVKNRTTSLNIDEDTKIFAKIASRNGYVEIRAKDEHDVPVEASTKQYPTVIYRLYDIDGDMKEELITLVREQV